MELGRCFLLGARAVKQPGYRVVIATEGNGQNPKDRRIEPAAKYPPAYLGVHSACETEYCQAVTSSVGSFPV